MDDVQDKLPLSERMRNPFLDKEYAPMDAIEGWWYRKLCLFADEVAQLEAALDDANGVNKRHAENYAKLQAERDALRTELDEKNYACGDALQKLWDEIIVANRPDYGDWEYAGQAYRHLKAEWDDLVKERDAFARDLGEWLSLARRQYAGMPHNEPLCPMLSGINKTEKLLGVEATRKVEDE